MFTFQKSGISQSTHAFTFCSAAKIDMASCLEDRHTSDHLSLDPTTGRQIKAFENFRLNEPTSRPANRVRLKRCPLPRCSKKYSSIAHLLTTWVKIKLDRKNVWLRSVFCNIPRDFMELVGFGHKTCNPNLLCSFACVTARNDCSPSSKYTGKLSNLWQGHIASLTRNSSDFHLLVTGGYSINDPRDGVALQWNLPWQSCKVVRMCRNSSALLCQKFRTCKGPNYGRIMLNHRSNRSQFKQTLPG